MFPILLLTCGHGGGASGMNATFTSIRESAHSERLVQPGPSSAFAHQRFAPRPHATTNANLSHRNGKRLLDEQFK
jgi:hypothetical protein